MSVTLNKGKLPWMDKQMLITQLMDVDSDGLFCLVALALDTL